MSRWIFLKLSPTFFPYFSEKQTSERPKCSSSGKKSELKKKKRRTMIQWWGFSSGISQTWGTQLCSSEC